MTKLFPITIAVLLLNLSIHHFKTQSLTSSQDISSLKSFISSISPSSILSWSCLASWKFSAADPCLLPSHRTHPRPGRLLRETHSANLPAHFLTVLDLFGDIPFSISSLSNLQSLNLQLNSFTGSIGFLTSLKRVESLEVVELCRNSLARKLESWLFDLSAIQQVNLENNSFTAIEVGRGGRQLVAVDLGFNRIGGKIPTDFARPSSIQSLTNPLKPFLLFDSNQLPPPASTQAPDCRRQPPSDSNQPYKLVIMELVIKFLPHRHPQQLPPSQTLKIPNRNLKRLIQPAEVGCGGGGFDGNVPAPPLVFHLAPAGFQLRGARGVDEPVRPEEEDRRRQIRVGLIGATLRREIRRREVPPQAARGDLGEVVLQRDLDPILN
ncbi:Brassinosteroid LRR receptor kinase BRI1 [Linum perenne]